MSQQQLQAFFAAAAAAAASSGKAGTLADKLSAFASTQAHGPHRTLLCNVERPLNCPMTQDTAGAV